MHRLCYSYEVEVEKGGHDLRDSRRYLGIPLCLIDLNWAPLWGTVRWLVEAAETLGYYLTLLQALLWRIQDTRSHK